VTLVLLTGVLLAWRSRTARSAQVAVGLVVLYLGIGWMQRERAESLVASAAAQRKHVITQHEVKPTLGNLLLWRSVYLHGNDYFVDAARVGLGKPVLYAGGSVRRIQPIDLVPPLNLNSVQAADLVRFARVSEGFLGRHPALPSVIGDVRYSMLPNSTSPLWGIEVHAEREDEHVGLRTFREFAKEDRQRFFAMLRGAPLEQQASARRSR
jgi:inner membrane protein